MRTNRFTEEDVLRLQQKGMKINDPIMDKKLKKAFGVATHKSKTEESLQVQVCTYLRNQYPNVMWACDLSSGMKLTIGQAVKAKKMRHTRGYPDIMIFQPSGCMHGLFIELKKEGTKIYREDGEVVSDDHIKEQKAILEMLSLKGYRAEFAIGFQQAKSIIDNYLNTNQ